MAELMPLAVSSAALLREICGPISHPTLTALAIAAGRGPKNIARDIAILVEAGLVTDRPSPGPGEPKPMPWLTELGVTQLAMLGRAERDAAPAPSDPPEGHVLVAHADLYPDPANRKVEHDDDLKDLAASIADKGLLQNLVVRPPDADGRRMLVAGERRWRAIGFLIDANVVRGGTNEAAWPAERGILCREFAGSPRDYALVQLIENLSREGLTPLEEADAFQRLTDEFGLSRVEIGKAAHCSDTLVRQRLALLALTAEEKGRLREGKLLIEDARRLVASRKPDAKLTPRQWLVLLETLDRCLAKPLAQKSWEDGLACQVGPASSEDEDAAALVDKGYLKRPAQQRDADGDETGHYLGGVQSYGLAQLKLKFGDNVDALIPRLAALSAIRTEALGAGYVLAGEWATPWLNPPFKLSAEVAAILAERKAANAAARAQREAAQAEEQRQRAASLAEREAARAREAALLEHVLHWQPRLGVDVEFAHLLSECGVRGPFSVRRYGDGGAVFAGETPIAFDTREGQEAGRRLFAIALNIATGQPPTSGPALADETVVQGDVGAFVHSLHAAADDDEDGDGPLTFEDDPDSDPALSETAGEDASAPAEAGGGAGNSEPPTAAAQTQDPPPQGGGGGPPQAVEGAADHPDPDDAEIPAFLRRLAGAEPTP